MEIVCCSISMATETSLLHDGATPGLTPTGGDGFPCMQSFAKCYSAERLLGYPHDSVGFTEWIARGIYAFMDSVASSHGMELCRELLLFSRWISLIKDGTQGSAQMAKLQAAILALNSLYNSRPICTLSHLWDIANSVAGPAVAKQILF